MDSNAAPSTKPSPRPKRLALTLAGLGLSLAAGLSWLVATESGLQASLGLARQLTGGQLQASGATGRLLGPLTLEQLSWTSASEQFQLQQLQLEWRPQALFQGRLLIQRLRAERLLLARQPGPESPPPQNLKLPLAVELETLELGALVLTAPDQPEPEARFTNLQARFSSDGEQHQLQHLSLKAGDLQLEAQGQLNGSGDMPLTARLHLQGQLAAHPLRLELQADGPLTQLPVTGTLAGEGSQGSLTASLTPFAPQPFSRLQARIQGLNPARWQSGAPQASLDINVDLNPEPGASLALGGPFELRNRKPGRLDQQGLPLESLKGRLDWRDSTLSLTDLDARLPGGGRATGKLELGLGATPTRFAVKGELTRLDPASLEKTLPKARINSRLLAHGTLGAPPHLTTNLALEFALNDSQIAGKPFTGAGKLALAGERLSSAELQLSAGPNRLQAKGALGLPGDSLQVDISAPRLADLGWAGDLEAHLKLTGALTTPNLNGTASSKQLSLPGQLLLQGLKLEARMGSQPQDPLEARLELTRLEFPGRRQTLSDTRLKLSGSRQQHRLELEANLVQPDSPLLPHSRLELAASGKLKQQWQDWQGSLEKLQLTPRDQPPFISLTAPAPLQLGRQIAWGPASFKGQIKGESWQASLAHLSRQGASWSSAGSLEHLPLAALLPLGKGNTLRLNGAWDFSLGPRQRGQLSLWRSAGDLQLGPAENTALGLSEARLEMNLEGKPRLQLNARGERLGTLQGQLKLDPNDPLHKPWNGQLDARMADIAWAGPLLGPDLQLGGQVSGQLQIAGSPVQPRLSGKLKGEALHLRALATGMRLENGQLSLGLEDQTLTLERFSFNSPHAPLPRALERDQRQSFAPILASPGRLEGGGQIHFGQNQDEARGHLDFRLERLGVMQKPDQWVALSGQGQLSFAEARLALGAQLTVDGGYWQLADLGAPSLSEDVVVRRKAAPPPASRPWQTAMDLQIDLGRAFHFAGAGVRSRLQGELHLQGEGRESPRASGTIRTQGGRYDAYGQQLEIERGILSFNGLVSNPGLNIRALRKHQPVEAGVSITGTARKPVIKLVSEPNVPDAEKLSWLVLGEAPEQRSGADYSTLLTAANAILGGQEKGPGSLLRDLQQALGVNVAIVRGTAGGSGTSTTSQVASTSGFGSGSQTATGQVVRVGTQLAKGLNLSYEQSLGGTESVVKLTLALSRQLSLVGQAGTDNAIDLFYTFRFGGPEDRRRRNTGTPAAAGQ